MGRGQLPYAPLVIPPPNVVTVPPPGGGIAQPNATLQNSSCAWSTTLSPVPWYRMCRNSGPEGEGPMTVANSGPPLLREWYHTRVPVAYICG